MALTLEWYGLAVYARVRDRGCNLARVDDSW